MDEPPSEWQVVEDKVRKVKMMIASGEHPVRVDARRREAVAYLRRAIHNARSQGDFESVRIWQHMLRVALLAERGRAWGAKNRSAMRAAYLGPAADRSGSAYFDVQNTPGTTFVEVEFTWYGRPNVAFLRNTFTGETERFTFRDFDGLRLPYAQNPLFRSLLEDCRKVIRALDELRALAAEVEADPDVRDG